MERKILHSDANSFYASVEMLYHPEHAGKPLAVGGDPEARHGIVLTANYTAKQKGVKTGQALWQANFVSESTEERLYIKKNLSSGWRNRRLEYFFERVNMLMYLKSGLERMNAIWVNL